MQVSDELIRVAILWHELWHEGLEEASRLYFGERNVKGMFDTLEPLHAMLERGPQTLKEISFNQVQSTFIRYCVNNLLLIIVCSLCDISFAGYLEAISIFSAGTQMSGVQRCRFFSFDFSVFHEIGPDKSFFLFDMEKFRLDFYFSSFNFFFFGFIFK